MYIIHNVRIPVVNSEDIYYQNMQKTIYFWPGSLQEAIQANHLILAVNSHC